MTYDETWRCPCPECNGLGPRRWDQFEDEDALMEPEHPENVSPERQGYEGPSYEARRDS